jgi:hypothetical protein
MLHQGQNIREQMEFYKTNIYINISILQNKYIYKHQYFTKQIPFL